MNTTTTTTDASGRVWPTEGAELVRTWNRSKPLRQYCDAYRMTAFLRSMRYSIHLKSLDYAPRGPSRNRWGENNRRWRKYRAAQSRVIFSSPFFDIVE